SPSPGITDFGVFVDWAQMGDVSRDAAPGKTEYKDLKELKLHARTGQWARNHSQRALVYRQLIKALPCRAVTADAAVYRDIVGNASSKRNPANFPLPEFVDGAAVPLYCLKPESLGSVHAVISCVAGEFPDVSHCPALPAVVSLLMHWSADESQCFEAAGRLLACNEPGRRMLDQTFLAYQSSCMTFGDLAHKYCPAAHKLIVAAATDVLEVYADWQRWVLGDLPFAHAARVMDVFLVEGYKVLYRIALAILKFYRKHKAAGATPRQQDSAGVKADIQVFVRGIGGSVSPDKLLEKAFSIRLFSRKEITLLQLANEKSLQQRGITVRQKRYAHDQLFVKGFYFEKRERRNGAFLSTDWEERKRGGNKLSYFGTGECFVFRMKPEMERYEWVVIKHPELANSTPAGSEQPDEGANGTSDANANSHSLPVETPPTSTTDSAHLSPFLAARHFHLNVRNTSMFMAGSVDSIIIGGGGEGNALYIDSELNHGRTGRCTTFDNPPLCTESFQIALLEVWGFQDAMAT
uniref:TBC1 domain family member 24 n=1 Tax=Astyanax mexicanus TaxID=7994 RepID=A0A8B9GWB9_ASTMX